MSLTSFSQKPRDSEVEQPITARECPKVYRIIIHGWIRTYFLDTLGHGGVSLFFSKMATRKRDRPAEGYYRNFERGFRPKAEKVSPKTPHKMDQKTL